jgi:hypothetical protein
MKAICIKSTKFFKKFIIYNYMKKEKRCSRGNIIFIVYRMHHTTIQMHKKNFDEIMIKINQKETK